MSNQKYLLPSFISMICIFMTNINFYNKKNKH